MREKNVISHKKFQFIEKFRCHLMSSVKDVDPQLLLADTITETSQRHTVLMQDDLSSFGLVQSLVMFPVAIPAISQEDLNNGLLMTQYSQHDLMQMQRDEAITGKVIRLLEAGNTLSANFKADSSDIHLFLKEWKHLEIQDNDLYRKHLSGTETVIQLILPKFLRSTVLQNFHDDFGHLGNEHTLELVRFCFYWPEIAVDIERKVKICESCVESPT